MSWGSLDNEDELKQEYLLSLDPGEVIEEPEDILTLGQLRREQGMTQLEAADAAHKTQEWVSLIERQGVRRTKLPTLVDYIAALGGQLQIHAIFGNEKHRIL